MRINASGCLLVSLLLFLCCNSTVAQNLDKIPGFLLNKGKGADSISFILTTNESSFFKGKTNNYLNSIQIIDANMPWPPRWFVATELDTNLGLPYAALIPLNASWQQGLVNYFAIVDKASQKGGFIFCNKFMEAVDTFILLSEKINHHELNIGKNGDRLYFATHDTVLDLRSRTGNAKDYALKCRNELIQIADTNGHITFSWDPLSKLGIEAEYANYIKQSLFSYREPAFDWAHGNSLAWDADGNILYSFRFIGIGKISRADGHIIWRIDRKNPRPNKASDTIPVFLQHDFKSFTNQEGQSIYSFWSNGDESYPFCTGYQFTVSYNNDAPAFRILNVFKPAQKIPNTNAGGNFDVEANGDFLANYGKFETDSSERLFFEYNNRQNKIIGQYYAPSPVQSYRIHKLSGWRPARPEISERDGYLYCVSGNICSWYKQSAKDKMILNKVSSSARYSPTSKGIYFGVVKYGIGYAVSLPFVVK